MGTIASGPNTAVEERFLDLAAYANDPADGDWTDILLSAIGAGHRRIHLNGRRFAFAMGPRRAITQPCELIFGPDHELVWAGPSRGPFQGAILCVRGAADVSILGPNIIGVPMMSVSGGRGANCHGLLARSGLAKVVVVDGGEGYRDAAGYADGFFDYHVVDSNHNDLPPRETGVVRFQIAGGKIVSGCVVSPGAGYIERPRGKDPPALMLGAAFPATSIVLLECKNPRVINLRQMHGRGVVAIWGGAGARLLNGWARDIGSAGVGVQIGPTDDVVVSGWNIKGVHGGIYHTAGIRLTSPNKGKTYGEDPVSSRVRITDNVVDDVNGGSCFDAVVCALRDIRFEHNLAIQRRPGGFFCIQIKLGRSSQDPKSPAGGVLGIVYRDNRSVQTVAGGLAVDFQNNSKWDAFEVDFDRSNTIECAPQFDRRVPSPRAGAGSCGLRVHNLTGGLVAPTILFAPVGVRSSGATRGVTFSPYIRRCRLGFLSDPGEAQPPTLLRDAEIHASELAAMIPSRGVHRLIDCRMTVHGYRLADEARIASPGSGLEDGEWNVFAAGSGSGLTLAVRVEVGRIAEADLLVPGEGYLDDGTGTFVLDVPPRGKGGAGSGGVLAVTVSKGSAVDIRVAEAGDSYLDGGSGSYEPVLPEHAHLIAVARGGKVVEVRVMSSGWRFHQPPVLEVDPAAGGGGVSLAIDLATRSVGAWFTDAEGSEISGGHYEGAEYDIYFARDERTIPSGPVHPSIEAGVGFST